MRKGSVAIIAELVGRCFTLCVCFFQNNVYCLMSTFIMSLLSKIDRNTQANFWDFISRAANNNTNPDGGSEHSLPSPVTFTMTEVCALCTVMWYLESYYCISCYHFQTALFFTPTYIMFYIFSLLKSSDSGKKKIKNK